MEPYQSLHHKSESRPISKNRHRNSKSFSFCPIENNKKKETSTSSYIRIHLKFWPNRFLIRFFVVDIYFCVSVTETFYLCRSSLFESNFRKLDLIKPVIIHVPVNNERLSSVLENFSSGLRIQRNYLDVVLKVLLFSQRTPQFPFRSFFYSGTYLSVFN